MATTPHTQKFQELQDHWRCATHVGKYCYKAHEHVNITEHVQMEPTALHDWATLCINCPERHTIFNLPRTQEFATYLKPKRTVNAPVQQPQQHPIIVQMPSRSRSRSRSRSYSPHSSSYSRSRSHHTPRTPPRSREPAPFSSPLVCHSSWDNYNGDGLLAFINWCEIKYKRSSDDTEFKEAYQILSSKKIGIDTLKNKDDNWYINKHKIQDGTADRLSRSYPKYCASLITW